MPKYWNPKADNKPRRARKRRQREALKQRFPEWKRIARPEAERVPARASLDRAGRILLAGFDRKPEKWGFFRTPLTELEARLGTPITEIISERIRNHGSGNPFKVFDLGCGAGKALSDLKLLFGDRIRTVGLVFRKTPKEKYKGVDSLLKGSVLDVKPREQFDFIFSHQGAIVHSSLKVSAMQRLVSWLKPGGIAVVDLEGDANFDKKRLQEVKTLLLQNGIKPTVLRKQFNYWILVFEKPRARLPG